MIVGRRTATWCLVGALLAALAFGTGASTETHKTEVLFLKAMGAERAAALYQKVLGVPAGTRLVPGRDGKTLVVHDMPERLARFRLLLRVLDRPAGTEARIYVRPTAHRAPSELTELVQTLVDAERVTLLPDDRSGSLVVQAPRADYLRLDRILRRLDVPGKNDRAIRVTPGPETGELPPLDGVRPGKGGSGKSKGKTRTKGKSKSKKGGQGR